MSGQWPKVEKDELESESSKSSEGLESEPNDDSETNAKGHDHRFRRRTD
jgi:hypothetical protein